MSIKFVDNSSKVEEAFKQQMRRGLEAIGQTAVGYAKEGTPVDTGRLRNSEDYSVSEEEKAVYIGTNVEYAQYVEFGHHSYAGRHFLKNAAANHSAEYKNIMESSLKA